ncbi:probable cytochrome P450 9f2 [Uranotaenia lowii]|uniref:probable cytochrome P450 9f2 n=1 Tax=Uranotaenia lowii TaxID=190385 RepID=UPI0024797DED|nr:probable cytochrome P450 9f2 [Uranotaenia lowii]
MEVDLVSALAIGAIVLLVYYYAFKKYQYFLSKPVPCLKPTLFLGSTAPMLFRQRDMPTQVRIFYDTFSDAKVIGLYDLVNPIYMLRDPEMIKKVGVKDFNHFQDHAPFMTSANDEEDSGESLFGNSLFALRGQKWRDMRATLSPAFTGSKIRHMYEFVAKCGQSMVQFLKAETSQGKELELEMKDVFSRFGNDVIATVAFGIEVDSLRDRDNDFYVKGKQLLSFDSIFVFVKMMAIMMMPKLMEKLGVDLADPKLTQYFKNMITDNMKQRAAHGIIRNDMIHMLMEVKKGSLKHQDEDTSTKDAGFATVEESTVGKASHTRVWNDNELIAQCFLFFLAGFDSISTAMSFLTYELCVNPDVQQKLYEEIVETDRSLSGKPLSYETLQKMAYMDMVVSEGLRKWPPAVIMDRYCTKDYMYDDDQGTRFLIEKGRTIWIPAIGIHRDPKYYPNPEKFDPERFSEENRSKINSGAYMPFGVGPRNCIGSRLALMEVKSVLFYLLKDFRLGRTDRTEDTVKLSKSLFGLKAENGIWVKFKPRSAL